MLSGRNINLENVGKLLRTSASYKRERRQFAVDSVTDWKPVKCRHMWGTWSSLGVLKTDYPGCVILNFLKFPEKILWAASQKRAVIIKP